MAVENNRVVLDQLRILFNVGTVRDLTDGQLLERFTTGSGEPAERAFAALVERHGAMVLRVCRSVLGDHHEAQDAFQATFLVLVSKARGLWVRDSLGPWLHNVAFRTASCARSARERRRRLERRVASRLQETRATASEELLQALHEEIHRLPERYRAPVVLCDLEGRTHEQAARHLGWPIGTVKSRLSRARERLKRRLVQRRVVASASLLASLPAVVDASLALPAALAEQTIRSAVQYAASRTLLPGAVASLAQGVLRTMLINRAWKTACVMLAAAITVPGLSLLAQQGGSGRSVPAVGKAPGDSAKAATYEVKRGNLKVDVVERGSLVSTDAADVFNHVEGRTTIVMLLPEGTHVTKGQVVCELDSAALRDTLTNQRIATQSAEAAYQNAKLAREIAEIALVEYEQGIYVGDQASLKGAIAGAQTALKKSERRLARNRTAREQINEMLRQEGRPKTPSDVIAGLDIEDRVDTAEESFEREQHALENAQTKLSVLQKYTFPKTVKELQSEVAKARADERAKEAAWELEQQKQKKLEDQIAMCTIRAPGDGVVIYAQNPTDPAIAEPRIEEGVTIRERQKIFSILDLSKPLRVNAKVHEAWIDKIKQGQKATIEVDAFPGKTFQGTVESVAPLPDSRVFNKNNRPFKVYTTLVRLDQGSPGLRPGMTAEIDILAAELEGVLSVPIQSVIQYGGKYHVAVRKPDGRLEWPEVTLGTSNGKVIEVKAGLAPGDLVELHPLDVMSEQEKRERFGEPPRPDSAK